MATIDEVGERDGWRCWLCDEPVDPEMSVNDARGPSVDARITKSKAKSKAKKRGAAPVAERLAHRSCNTGKGNIEAIVAWPDHLFIIDPAPIIPIVERLALKGGREAVSRCPTAEDADRTAAWIVDRVSRLAPDLSLAAHIEPGGGQFVVILEAGR